MSLIDPQGSTATTITVDPDDPVVTVGQVGAWDEYGNTLAALSVVGPVHYGWLGGKERATDASGLVLMGARLYNTVTGLFTSVDPVPGGNTTDYTYPQDPTNKQDLNGHLALKKWLKKGIGTFRKVMNNKWVNLGLTIASVAACAACTALLAVNSLINVRQQVAKKNYGGAIWEAFRLGVGGFSSFAKAGSRILNAGASMAKSKRAAIAVGKQHRAQRQVLSRTSSKMTTHAAAWARNSRISNRMAYAHAGISSGRTLGIY